MDKITIAILIVVILILAACSSTPYEIELSRQIINTFSIKMKKVNNLTLIGLGYRGGDPSGKLKAFSLTYVGQKFVNIEQARDLFIGLCEELLAQINANKKMKPWLADYPYTGKNLNIMLAFYEEPSKKVSPPYIALVSVLNGWVYYSTYENGKLTDAYEETYEDALKIYQDNHPEIQNSSQP
jgi:hypothetical protein